ncbi:acyl carrier protein [Paenactinomyces guangxiensis]|uniref:Acyl carrier protein n=1 Tax=Paenactinomyces guangxiensis TaxID=1490290 RepID=A0A7W1WP46_9BACL|nr:acyl carrier protein [Paenactinomyces guangxiensis]MBA4493467.1 acyl carrier protein [Paenactinomyces guangxiensis]MBH8590558.1 acyl carrier protein [Paenactinomyces guangxiensis]
MGIFQEVLKIVIEELDERTVLETQLTGEESLIEDLGFDSIMLLQLIIRLEDHFQIDFEVEDMSLELFKSINSLTGFIEHLIEKEK